MLKQVPKASEKVNSDKINICSPNLQENNMIISKNGFLHSKSQPQKIVLTPMPKITSNRLPITATTNSVQPKFTVLPMSVPTTEPEGAVASKVYNFQIADGRIQCADPSINPVTIMKDSNENSVNINHQICKESSNKNDVSNNVYELSIAEDSLSNQSDSKLVVSSSESNSSYGDLSAKPEPKQRDLLKFSHGVSILKKTINNASSEKKLDSFPQNSDCNTDVLKVSNIPDEKVAHKPERERRRKSQFSFRKDFDEDEIKFPDPLITPKVEEFVEEEKNPNEIEMKVLRDPKSLFQVNKDFDPHKILKWNDGIGTLPGSNLKFIINEFNIIEYVSDEDYRNIIELRLKKAREKMKEELEEEIRCLECGCYGLRSDFINSDYCSIDCQELGMAAKKREIQDIKIKKKKRKFGKMKSDTDIKCELKQEIQEGSEDEISNNEASQDKFSYPWACKKKGFSWSKYLTHVQAKAAPVKLFKEPFPYTRNGFRTGMKFEGVDPQHPSYFCVLSVVETVGYRIRVHFDGYPTNYDFWCNADSMDIFPMGWCEKYGHTLQPPSGYSVDNFNWIQYLKVTKSTAAPKHLFANRAGQAICPNGFRIGMKLEAVDRKNTSLVCVATVRDMMDNRILVHFDGWDDIYDYWADPTSPYIHPVGWCDQYGHNLTPPSDYPTPETFSWEVYLKESKSAAAPVRAFKQRPACGFKRGMRLECVDKRVPHLIRVSTVDDVKEHQIRIHFDGWPDRYSYWVDDDSPDIHPIGWCQKTGHPIEPPLTPDDVYDFLECPTVGCRGLGHIKGLKYPTHNSRKYCPYAEENIDMERRLPDRLLSPDRNPEAVIPVSREPKECKIKPRVGRPPKYLKRENTKPDLEEEPKEKKQKPVPIKKEEDLSSQQKLATEFLEQSKCFPAEKESFKKHSRFLNKYLDLSESVLAWSPEDVAQFVASIPGCETASHIFKSKNVDGESFLYLSQKDILSFFNIKVGPAIKLYNSIVLLRQKFL
ncbi:lethal(3)malignant brain tumor-like protein 4 isoform X2 [Cylas formicarius]|nr:lethal(3)malignant brain tumor-like protein 4 isoform X2 [Cylas formicarius]